MKTELNHWHPKNGWRTACSENVIKNAQIVFVFGSNATIASEELRKDVRLSYPKADIISASTSGEINDTSVTDDSLSVLACEFEKTEVKVVMLHKEEYGDSATGGRMLCERLSSDTLTHVLLITDGISVNGDDLVTAMKNCLSKNVTLSGGLASDGGKFIKTLVGLNDDVGSGRMIAIGYYGDQLEVSCGTQGGWDVFGPHREVTRSEGNVLFELDGENALDVYKRYLGPRAAELPGSALLFPLSILNNEGKEGLVRTILSVDDAAGSMTFAGNIPMNSMVQFMLSNTDRLVDGATGAARRAKDGLTGPADMVLMISCVGRKIVLDQRVEEEVEGVCDVFGKGPAFAGFYSNGEIAPPEGGTFAALHNQTMTITAYREK
jgi:hypothetical protein